jgi:hypothetical protein
VVSTQSTKGTERGFFFFFFFFTMSIQIYVFSLIVPKKHKVSSGNSCLIDGKSDVSYGLDRLVVHR